MAVKNEKYWAERFKQLEASQHQSSERLADEIQQQMRRAEAEIERKINAWYGRLMANNGVSMAEAKRLLNNKELEEFRWDVKDYIKHGQDNAYTQQWMKELENASARAHISRLEQLKLQVQQEAEKLYGNYLDNVDQHMKSLYEEGFYKTAYEIQKGVGVGWNLTGVDSKQLEKIIRKPWAADGKNFSERIWSSKQQLIDNIHTSLTQMCILGQSPDRAINSLAKAMQTSKNQAGRLIMTEAAFFGSEARKGSFHELGVEQYEIVATLDAITSEICREMDGKVFPMSEYIPGSTAPPFHVWCRSTTVPAFGDEFDKIGERAARDADGKTYYVPADMKYQEWKKTFVDGDKSGLQETSWDDTIKAQEEVKQVVEELRVENFPPSFTEKRELKNTQTLVDYVNGLEGADANVVALFNRIGKLENIESNGIQFTISHAKNHAVSTSTYRTSGNIADVKLTIPKLQGDNLVGQVNTMLHEEMHLMDLYGRQNPQKSGNWFSTSRKPLVDAFRKTSDSMSDDVVKLFNEHNQEYRKVRGEVNSKYSKLISELNDSIINRTFQGSYNDYKKQYNKLVAAKDAERDYLARNIMGGGIGNLQDIYDALSGGVFRDAKKVIYGHGSSYYMHMESRVHETIANYAALSVTRPDLIKLLRADKPELVAELDATIAELLKKAGGE